MILEAVLAQKIEAFKAPHGGSLLLGKLIAGGRDRLLGVLAQHLGQDLPAFLGSHRHTLKPKGNFVCVRHAVEFTL